jgi:hypothetical protein
VHIKVAAILNLVMCGLDFLYALLALAAAILFPLMDTATSPDDPPPWVFSIVAGVMLLLAATAGTLKLVAGMKLLKLRPNARGWTLAAGIVGCGQLWCSYFCVLPLGIGIYSIVVACLDSVKQHLLDVPAAQQETPAG